MKPEEEEKKRRRQMIYLSHYASEPMSSWNDRTTWELDDAHADLNRIIKMENGEKPED